MTGGDATGEFDDDEHVPSAPLLPPEDRLWRHPSEVAAERLDHPMNTIDVRNRWLAREPTRATAWTAGLVGALLATGIVLVGTHLGTFLTKSPTAEQTAENAVVPTSPAGTTPAATARGYGLGAALATSILRLGGATVSVHVFTATSNVASLGIVLANNGTVVTAAAALEGATSILVEPPKGGVELVASVVAIDRRSGLAILHVNRMPAMPSTTLDGPERMTTSAFALLVTSAGGSTYAPASLTSVDITPKIDGTQLVDATATDLSAAYAPLGSPVLDNSGNLIGMVVGTVDGDAVISPAWILSPIADELDDLGSVSQGWMGINGVTLRTPKKPTDSTGIEIQAVSPHSAAAKAGIVPGDVITSIDGTRVASITALQGHLYTDRPGEVVTVGLATKTRRELVSVTLDGSSS